MSQSMPQALSQSNSSFCLFLGDLSLFCTEKDILASFSPYGSVTNVRIKRSNENKKHLLYGFVEYSSAAEAVQAMQAMNGSLFLGRTLRVRWASNKQGRRIKGDNESGAPHGPSVFVVFLVYDKQQVVNEITLRSVFGAFGCVDDVVVKQSKVDPLTGQQKGYGFVQFSADWAGIDAAMTAVSNLDNFIIDGVGYKCEVSYNTEELRRQLSNNGPAPSTASAPAASAMPSMAPMAQSQQQMPPQMSSPMQGMPMVGMMPLSASMHQPSMQPAMQNMQYGKQPSMLPMAPSMQAMPSVMMSMPSPAFKMERYPTQPYPMYQAMPMQQHGGGMPYYYEQVPYGQSREEYPAPAGYGPAGMSPLMLPQHHGNGQHMSNNHGHGY